MAAEIETGTEIEGYILGYHRPLSLTVMAEAGGKNAALITKLAPTFSSLHVRRRKQQKAKMKSRDERMALDSQVNVDLSRRNARRQESRTLEGKVYLRLELIFHRDQRHP